MPLEQEMKDLKDKLACQDEQICRLKEKLTSHDKIVAQKDELQIEYKNLKQWLEDEFDNKYKKINTDLSKSLDSQKDKLKKAEMDNCKLRTENEKLIDVNERICEQLNAIQENEQKLRIEIDELEVCKSRDQSELCHTKCQLEEYFCMVDNLTKALRSKEEEYRDIQRQIEECNTVNCRLDDTCKNLESELLHTKSEIEKVRVQEKLTEDKLKLEQKTMSNELEVKCQKLRVVEMDLEDTKRMINQEKFNAKKLKNWSVELRDASEKDICEMKTTVNNLMKENCAKDDQICQLKEQITKKEQENECITTEIMTLKKQIEDNECLLEKMKQSAEVFQRIKDENYEKLDKEKKELTCEVHQKTEIIDELERQLCCLKEKLKEQQECPRVKCVNSSEDGCCCPQNEKSCVNNNNNTTDVEQLVNDLKQLYSGLDKIKESVKDCLEK